MTEIDPHTTTQHIRRLGGEALVAFVVDLWDVRGYETRREGDVIEAARGAETVRLWVPDAAAPHGQDVETSRFDVVVAPDGDSGGLSDDVRVVDAATLCEMLRYAVERPAARELCRRHLWTTPDSHSPLRSRARRRAQKLTEVSPPLVFGVVVLLGAGAIAGFLIGADAVGENARRAADTASAVERSPLVDEKREDQTIVYSRWASANRSNDSFSEATPPPGVVNGSITDVEALAAAHEAFVGSRSHTISFDRYRPRDLKPNGTRVQRDIDMVAEEERHLVEIAEKSNGSRTRLGAIYREEGLFYSADWDEANEKYHRILRIDPRQTVVPSPITLRDHLVSRYLSTPETTVTRLDNGSGATMYRIVGTGSPAGLESADNYTVAATVDSRGFVRDLTAEYSNTISDQPYRTRVEVTYEQIGSTRVGRPAWYERLEGPHPGSADRPGAGTPIDQE